MQLAIKKLQRLCRRWGGDLLLVGEDAYHGLVGYKPWREAPFENWHALHWDAKLVLAIADAARVGPLIHEMGHVFAVRNYPGDEWQFLGWEAAVARQVGAYETWSQQNWNYGTNDGVEWGALTRAQRLELIDERIADAKLLGTINKRGRAVSIRGRT